MTISDFLTYSDSCKEERPLYLFDKKYGPLPPSLLPSSAQNFGQIFLPASINPPSPISFEQSP